MDPQGTNPLAKADTVLLVATFPALTFDQSQYSDGLTSSSTAVYETSSALRAIHGGTGRELYVRVSVTTAHTNKVILIHADTANIANHTYQIKIDGSKNIVCSQNNVTLFTLAPALAATSSLSIHWSTRPNPDTTGASDAVVSEFVVYNHTTSAYLGEITQVAHAVSSTNTTWALCVGGYWSGALTFASGQVSNCRIGRAWHTAVEFAEDWIVARSAHGSSLPQLMEPLPIRFDSGLADESEWCGQANVGYCAASADQNRGRLVSNLINEVYSDARSLTSTPNPTQWLAGPPGGTSVYRLDALKLRWLPHPGPTRAYVRVHVQSWVIAGAAVPIGIRVYAFNRPHLGVGPSLDGFPTPALDFDFVQATLTANHGANGVGVWLSLGLLRLPRFSGSAPRWIGTTMLCLAHAFDPSGASANDANARLKIKAWHVRPVIGVI